MGRGGASEVLPLQKKRGGDKVLASLKGGTKGFGEVLIRVLEVLTILEGGHKRFPPCKKKGGGGGHNKFDPVLRGSQKVLDPRFSHFVAPPPPRN